MCYRTMRIRPAIPPDTYPKSKSQTTLRDTFCLCSSAASINWKSWFLIPTLVATMW